MNTIVGRLICLSLCITAIGAAAGQSDRRSRSKEESPARAQTATFLTTSDGRTNCQSALDLVFVIDTSGSIAACGCGAFDQMKAFAKGIVSQFQAGPADAHFGIIDFSSSVVRVLPLSDGPAAIDTALDTMPFLGFGTDTTDGLIQAQQEIQLHGRPAVNHAILLLTDGQADDGPSAISAAADAKSAGTTIFSIGVTSLIDLTQLQQIASNPSEAHVFNVSTFDALASILQQLVTNICPPSAPVPTVADLLVTKTGTPDPVVAGAKLTYVLTVQNNGPGTATNVILTDQLPPEVSVVTVAPSQGNYQEQNGVLTCNLGTLANGASATVSVVVRPAEPGPSTTGCEGAIDLMFVIDTSGSVAISAGAFDKIKAFANNVVAKFNLSAIGPHLGIVDFSSSTDTRLVLGLSDDAPTVESAIETMPLFGNGTDIVGGLATAKAEIDQHGRPGVNPAIILLTDGRADDGSNPEAKAAEIKAAGTQIFSIGVTDLIDLSQLRQIASNPVETHLFTVENYDGLPAILEQLIINVCPPALETSICNTVNVQATEADPALDNNRASACTVVKAHALLKLTAARSGQKVVLTWPGWATGFVLESAGNGVIPLRWNPVTTPPALVGDRAAVTQDLDPAIQIYRLVEP